MYSYIFQPISLQNLTHDELEIIFKLEKEIIEIVQFGKKARDFSIKNKPCALIPMEIRPSIRKLIEERYGYIRPVEAERIVLARILNKGILESKVSPYKLSFEVRKLMFPQSMEIRLGNATFSYAEELKIRPPIPSDPIFHNQELHKLPGILSAINFFLAIVSSHPYVDGNGRTARVVFNWVINSVYKGNGFYLPFARLTDETNGEFEEYLSSAALEGDYMPAFRKILSILHSAILIDSSVEEIMTADSFIRASLLSRISSVRPQLNLNEIPPYIVSIKDLPNNSNLGNSNYQIMMKIAIELSSYSNIEFAISTLTKFVRSSNEILEISFFITIKKKEELQLSLLNIKEKYRHCAIFTVVPLTADVVLDAKILINVVSKTLQRSKDLIVLCDFDKIICNIDNYATN